MTDYMHPVTGKRMAYRTLEETHARMKTHASRDDHGTPLTNSTRSTIDGIRAARHLHVKAGRIIMQHGEQDERGMYWDDKKGPGNGQFRSIHPDIHNTARNPTRSTIDGIRTTRTAHIKAGRITPMENDMTPEEAAHRYATDADFRNKQLAVNAKNNPTRSTIDGHRTTRSGHIKAGRITDDGTDRGPAPEANGSTPHPRVAPINSGPHVRAGLTISLNRTKARKRKGKSDRQVNREESWLYGLCLDPRYHTYKNGNSQNVMDDYLESTYRYRLDWQHENAKNLPWLLVYRCAKDGRDIEKFVISEMRRLGAPGGRNEDSIWFSDEEFVAAMKAVCSKIKGLTLVYDHLAGGIVGKKSLTTEAECGMVDHHAI